MGIAFSKEIDLRIGGNKVLFEDYSSFLFFFLEEFSFPWWFDTKACKGCHRAGLWLQI